MRRKILPLIFALLFILSIPVGSSAIRYSDIDGHWSEVYVEELSNGDLINGYEDGTFKPNDNITRVEFYKLINQLAGLKKTYSVTFTDVKKEDWFYEEVAKGIKAGYIMPTTGNLNPNVDITRQEALRIIGYMYDLAKMEEACKDFFDVDKFDKNAIGYVGALVHYKIVEGYPDNTFRPKDAITRGEISKILNLLVEKLGNPSEKFITDSEVKFGAKNLYD